MKELQRIIEGTQNFFESIGISLTPGLKIGICICLVLICTTPSILKYRIEVKRDENGNLKGLDINKPMF